MTLKRKISEEKAKMKLYLVRHGEAVSEQTDPQRPLSPQGREQAQRVASLAKDQGIFVRRIYHSGKKRAEETAQIFQSVLNLKCPSIAKDFLSPNAPIDQMYYEILRATEDLMIVGHMPFLSRLTSKLVSGTEDKEMVAFKTGTLVALEKRNDKKWQVLFSFSPS